MERKIELEMGYTCKEFTKSLQGQFTSQTDFRIHQLAENHWQIQFDQEATVDLKIHPAAPRKIGMLTLPVIKASFQFSHTKDHQQTQFFSTFSKYFHKGGG